VKRAGTNNVSVALTLDLHGGEQITGLISDGSWQAAIIADRATFGASNPATGYAGAYTMLFPGSEVMGEPAGDGVAGFAIDTLGNIKLAGSVADSSALVQKVPLSKHGVWPLYVPLYAGRGSFLGWVAVTNSLQPDLGGATSWSRPAGPAPKVHTNGFAVYPMAIGSGFRALGTNKIFEATTARISFHAGNLATDFTNEVTLLPSGKISYSGTNKLTLTFVPTSGQFSGSVVPPGATKPVLFKGALLQKQGYGGGYFLGTNESGRVYFAP